MLKQITAIIVDDEQDAIDSLYRIVSSEIPEIVIIATAKSTQVALEIVIDKQPDLIFLDIQMPINDGFWLAEKINKIRSSTSIIFVTAYDEYAISAIKHAAFDFLTKPVIPQLLKDSIDRYKTSNNGTSLDQKLDSLKAFFNKDKLKFNTNNGFLLISPEEIIYCQADRNYCNIFISNGKNELVTVQLGVLEKKLLEESFIKINRSTIINLAYLEYFNQQEKKVTLRDTIQEYEIEVSSSGAKKLKKLY